MPRQPIGRPPKYEEIIGRLVDEELYSPGSIARFAEEQGLLVDFLDLEPNRKKVMLRIRIAMGRASNNNGFPDEGDGRVKVPGQAPVPGWYGWRWKLIYT